MKTVMFVMLFVMVGIVGCQPLSKNKQLAYSDSAGTLAAVIALDEVPDATYDVAREKTIEVAAALLAFVETGDLGKLSFNNTRFLLVQFLTSKGWGDYSGLVDTALQYVRTQNVNVDAIGGQNVLLIRTGIEAVIRSATRCKKEWKTN